MLEAGIEHGAGEVDNIGEEVTAHEGEVHKESVWSMREDKADDTLS